MADSSAPARPPRRTIRRVPPFYPVPLQRRQHNGWLPGRQADFLGHLAETRSVLAAARRVGMSRESAYRLRRRAGAESFAAAWDAALGMPVREVTVDDVLFLAYQGLIRPRHYAGRYVGWTQVPDDKAFLRLLGQMVRHHDAAFAPVSGSRFPASGA